MKKALFCAIVLAAAPALAEQRYATYEGRDSVQVGNGGTKITENGIDYWTTGAPPRRYQILGILTDARKNRLADGKVLGSKSVAKKTIEAGGNAVLFASSSTRTAGVAAFANGNTAFARPIDRTTTELVVIRYLPDQ